jgi:succinoglycan biosynthesis protein ExoA
MKPKVSVLTPVLNESAHVRSAVGQISAQAFDGELELLFVDGGSSDDTVAILRELKARDPRIRILENPDRFTPHGLNIGLRHASGDYVARMDAHTLYPEDYLATGVRRLQGADVTWVSGPQLPVGDGRWSSLIARALGSPLGIGGAAFRRAGAEEVEVDSGFTGVWRRSTLERHGGWDEGWPVNQDGELAARIRADGGRIVCLPEMAASYIPRDSLRSLSRQYRRYGFYRVKTSRRHPTSMRRSHLLAPGLALAVLALPVTGRRLRGVASAGVAVYAAAVGVTSARLAERPAQAPALSAVFATMHLSWGFGFLAGCARFGPPLRAIAALRRDSTPS